MFLITGCAGFIGFHLSVLLLKKGQKVVGIDNLNNYYDYRLKINRLKILKNKKNFIFKKLDLTNLNQTKKVFYKYKPKTIFHLASQPGVIYSYKNPNSYKKNNIIATKNLIKISNELSIKKIIFTSSSSVYGDHKRYPINESFKLKPKNFYAVTKKKCERLLREKYFIKNINNLYILRPFTVYGEYGRPDMLIIKILNQLNSKKPFFLYNYGNYIRDFTYVKDVAESIYKVSKLEKGFLKLNICASKPINVNGIIKKVEKILKRKIKFEYRKKRKGEMIVTYGSNKNLFKNIGQQKFKSLNYGLKKTILWYKNFKHKKFLIKTK